MITIIVAVVVAALLGFAVINLLKKVEKLEEIALSQTQFISHVTEVIKSSNEKLKEIDDRGTFASDDEVGWFFEQLKSIQDELNQFRNEKT